MDRRLKGNSLKVSVYVMEDEKNRHTPTSLLIATNTDGVSERVGIFHNYSFCMQDGGRVSSYKDQKEDFLGMLEKKLQLRTIRLG